MSKWQLADIPSQAGKCAFITGANSGIGFHAARHLACAGCAVILACRDAKKGEAARQRIKQESPTAEVTVAALDLASLASVRSCAASLLEAGKQLDLLIDNAGVMAFPTRQTTADGFERQFGTNHLGHFALTGLLLPLVLAAPAGRVVTVSSIAHGQGAMRFDDLQYTTGYEGWAVYNQSKLANLLFAFELQRRLERAGAKAVSIAVHPGVSRTSILANGPANARDLKSRLLPFVVPLIAQTDEQGSFPTLYAATSPMALGGRYFGPDGFMGLKGSPVEVKAKPQALDEDSAGRLWSVSEDLTGVRYSALD
jgi:NAD(P)-dependent dehydrogenase (short-subunit alcohol dehydrogenase family)